VSAPAATAPATGGGLKRNLGLLAIVGLGLGYMTPTVVFDQFGNASDDTNGAVPSAYIVALVIMALTAVSYGKLVKVFPSAGSAFTYVRESMHPNLGFLVGWSSLLDYLLLPMVNALILRLYVEQLFPDVPPWLAVVVYAAAASALVAYSMRGTSNINGILLVGALVVMFIFLFLTISQLIAGEGAGTVASTVPFIHEGVHFQPVLIGATVVCFSFIGFDAVTMYAEEAKSPNIMPKAILLTVMIGGIIFVVWSYFTQLRFPDNSLFGEYSDDPLPQIGFHVGGPVFQWVLTAAGAVATIASGLASHASVARLLLVMGRNNVLPKALFGRVNPKTRTPIFNVVLVGVVCLLAIFLTLEQASAFINFGALIAFSFVNLSVIAHFAWRQGRRKTGKDIFNYIVMPGLGFALTLILWAHLHHEAQIAGGIWAVIGVIYLAIITKGFRRQPQGFDENQPVTGINKLAAEESDEDAVGPRG